MATLADSLSVKTVGELVQNHTVDEVADISQAEFPNQRGFSVKRFCRAHGRAKRKHINDVLLHNVH